MKKNNYLKDEILEAVWVLKEKNLKTTVENVLKQNRKINKEAIEDALNSGFLSLKDGVIDFLTEGSEEARILMRRHRLAERLLSDVLDMSRSQLEAQACEFEHILSPETTDSICTLLSHPRECPHGGLIPEGDCCREFRENPKQIVIPLSELLPGDKAKILYIACGSEEGLLQRLGDLQISPGEVVTLHQKSPVGVIRTGETDVALEKSILNKIFVRRPNI